MKKSLLILLTLLSRNVWAASQLTCKVSEELNPPLQPASVSYTLAAPLKGPALDARIDFNARTANLTFGVETFLSALTSPGKQVVLIGIADVRNGAKITVDGHDTAEAFYDTDAESLYIQCSTR